MPEVRGASSVPIASPQRPGDWLDTGLLLLAGALLLALGLGAYPLWDPGEGRNAQTAREMAAAGRWLVPLLYGESYDDKPAPFFDLLRGFQAVFGPGEAALRLPSALATLGSLLLLHRFARARVDRSTAALAGIIFLTSPEVVALARFCNFDATLSFFVTAAIVAWLGWLDSPRERFPWHAYVAMGLGVLVKGPVAVLLPVLIAAGCAYRRGALRGALAGARPVLGAGIVAALVAPWIVPATIVDPHYVKTFLLHHNLERYLSSHFEHVHGVLFYVPVILGGLFPWSLLLPVAALADARRGLATDAAIWAGTIILFFSLGQSKLATYVLPAFPALALWLAIALHALAVAPRERTRRLLDGAIVLWASVLILFPVGALTYVWATYPELYRAVAWSLPLPLLGWFGARSLRTATPRPLAVCVVFAVSNAVLVASFYHGAAPLISPIASDAAIASFARRRAPQASIIGYRVQPASLAYYSDQPVRRTKQIEDVREAASKGPLLVVTRRRYADNLRAAGIPLYELLDTRRHLLYATVPVS